MKKIKDAMYKLERTLLKLNEKYEFYKNDKEQFKELDKAFGKLTNEIMKKELKEITRKCEDIQQIMTRKFLKEQHKQQKVLMSTQCPNVVEHECNV